MCLVTLQVMPAARPPPPRPAPMFSPDQSERVQAEPGEGAVLHCAVLHPGRHTVSWIRNTDLQILTVGSHKFCTDRRVSVSWDRVSGDTALHIRQAAATQVIILT